MFINEDKAGEFSPPYFFVKPRRITIDLPGVLPLLGKSTEVAALTHAFPKHCLQP